MIKVGTSERTLGKHALLNKVMGREAGIIAMRLPVFMARKYLMVDLCAGDGRNSPSNTCSPKIMTKHYDFLKNHGVETRMLLIEKNKAAFDSLAKQGFPGEVICDDARNITSLNVPDNCPVFIHADPNHVEDWPLSDELISNLPRYTTLLVTLGCNVGGIKRLPFDAREKWFNRMDNLLYHMPSHHDAVLVVLRGDSAQWAYLLVGPIKWAERYIKDAQSAFSYWENGIEYVQFKGDEAAFRDVRRRLFLTAKEGVTLVSVR